MRLFYPILIATVFATSSAIAADVPQKTSWQQIKNQHIIKQDQDYSCGLSIGSDHFDLLL